MLSRNTALRILFVLAVVGMLVDGYLTITHLFGGPITCAVGHGCDVIRASTYSRLWGIPIAIFGFGMYVFLAGLITVRPPYLMTAITLITGLGVTVSAFLTYLQIWVIEAICSWCVASAVLVTLMFIVALLTNKSGILAQPMKTKGAS